MEFKGFKKVNLENWLKPDDMNSCFVRLSEDCSSHHTITDIERLKDILVFQLDDCVPVQIHKLFEVARGAIAYGYYFYPLYTLGTEQLYRVADAALMHKYIMVSGKKKQISFDNRIKYFESNGIFTSKDKVNWHCLKQLRNLVSHPDDQMIIMPNNAVETLYDVSTMINSLFSK